MDFERDVEGTCKNSFLESTKVCSAKAEQKAEQFGEEEGISDQVDLFGFSPQFYLFEHKPSNMPDSGERQLSEKGPRWVII